MMEQERKRMLKTVSMYVHLKSSRQNTSARMI
jgi:hypothetical protein